MTKKELIKENEKLRAMYLSLSLEYDFLKKDYDMINFENDYYKEQIDDFIIEVMR